MDTEIHTYVYVTVMKKRPWGLKKSKNGFTGRLGGSKCALVTFPLP